MKRYRDDEGRPCMAGKILNAISVASGVSLKIEGSDMLFCVSPDWTLRAGLQRMSQFLGGYLVQYESSCTIWVEEHSFTCRFSPIGEEDQYAETQRLIAEEPAEPDRIDGPVYQQIRAQILADLGLTMRDRFALAALTTLATWTTDSAMVAERAYELADAMISERTKETAR